MYGILDWVYAMHTNIALFMVRLKNTAGATTLIFFHDKHTLIFIDCISPIPLIKTTGESESITDDNMPGTMKINIPIWFKKLVVNTKEKKVGTIRMLEKKAYNALILCPLEICVRNSKTLLNKNESFIRLDKIDAVEIASNVFFCDDTLCFNDSDNLLSL